LMRSVGYHAIHSEDTPVRWPQRTYVVTWARPANDPGTVSCIRRIPSAARGRRIRLSTRSRTRGLENSKALTARSIARFF
jgi:hypothetical protein